MDLTERLLGLTLGGAVWVLWLLVGLSVLSIGVMLDRLVALRAGRLPDALFAQIEALLKAGNHEGALNLLNGRRGIEALVATAGLSRAARGGTAAGEAMAAARMRERVRLERNLAFLGTLGSNAPFIGLFGTVLGIIKAFHDLSQSQSGGTTAVMSGISEALVATAVGLLVAIPAVVAFNSFQRSLRRRVARADELAHWILASLDPVRPAVPEDGFLAAASGDAAARA